MKIINYKQIKSINNLPKYDLGTKPINSGYQVGSSRNNLSGYYTQNAAPINNSFVAEGITSGLGNLTQAAPLLYNGIKNVVKPVATTTASVEPAAATEAAASTTGSTTGSTVAGIAGKATGVLAGVYGTAQLIGNQLDYSNTLTGSDLQTASAKSTEYANGVSYERIGGYDKSAANKYVSDQNKASAIKGVTSGLTAGAGIGSLFSPVGTLIGAGVGALVGGIGSILGGSHRKDKYEREARNFTTQADAYNEQNESVAASQGMRNKYVTHGDTGLDNATKANQTGTAGYGEVQTANGMQFGPINSIVRKGETIWDPNTGDAHVVDTGTKGKDTEPSDVGPNDNKVVFGRLINPETGNKFEDDAAPIAKRIETVKNLSWVPKAVRDNFINTENEKMLNLANKQAMLHQARQNKSIPKYNDGVSKSYAYAPAALGMLGGLVQYLDYSKSPIDVRNSYTPNTNTQKSLDVLGSLRYDERPQLRQLNNVVRQSQYNINQSPYSAGQRMGMMSNLYNTYMQNSSNIRAAANEENNKYKSAYADALMKAGEADATRRQQANSLYNDQLAKANAVRQKGKETGINNMLSAIYKGYENMFNLDMFDKNVELWRDDQQIERDKLNIAPKKTKTQDNQSYGKDRR